MYKDYCCGCGLCASAFGAKIDVDEKGFRRIKDEQPFTDKLKLVCPVSGVQCNDLQKGKIWGKEKGVYLSYSTNEEIRHSASSGGALTELCLYLLENKLVDGIIHVKADEKEPIGTTVVCSTTREEVVSCCGSRYSSSMPLYNIKDFMTANKKYAVVAKPCDITALHNYMKIEPKAKETFVYLFSFFCAGAPSKNANLELLRKLDCKLEDCVSLKYRGDGWPGYATAIDKKGQKHKLTYREAWRDTLGRDIRLACRFCLDGIGELADISACDAWYLNDKGDPVFEESKGRNAVFCRTSKGLELFNKAVSANYLTKEEHLNYEKDLGNSQKYQYQRRSTMSDLCLAMKLCFKSTPSYDKTLLKSYSQKMPTKVRVRRFVGTIKRISQNKFK